MSIPPDVPSINRRRLRARQETLAYHELGRGCRLRCYSRNLSVRDLLPKDAAERCGGALLYILIDSSCGESDIHSDHDLEHEARFELIKADSANRRALRRHSDETLRVLLDRSNAF